MRAAASETLSVLGFLFAADDIAFLRFFHTLLCRLTLEVDDSAGADSVFARKASHAAPSARDVGHISLGGGRATTEEEAANTAAAEALAIAAALRAWTLCASVCASRSLAGAVRHRHLPRIAALLEHSSLDVRVAAGEAIAVVFSAVNRRRALDDPTAAAAAKAAQRAAEAAAGGAIDTDAALAMAAAVEEDSAAVDDEAVKQMLEEDDEYDEEEEDEEEDADDGSDEENVLDENAALNKGWGGAVTYADEDLPERDEPLKSALEELATDSAFCLSYSFSLRCFISIGSLITMCVSRVCLPALLHFHTKSGVLWALVCSFT